MLPKQFSFELRKESSFFTKARKSFSSHFTYFFMPTQAAHTQAVVLVNKKVSAKATQRNALKRLLYQQLHEVLTQNAGAVLKWVVVPKKSALSQNTQALKDELELWFQRSNNDQKYEKKTV